MQTKSLDEITQALRALDLDPDFDLIIAIGRGGVAPAALVADIIKRPVETLTINYRDDSHQPQHEHPVALDDPAFEVSGKKILIVDDVSRSGQTLELAKQILNRAKTIKTLVINGQADYSAFDEDCFRFPWHNPDSPMSS